MGSEQPPQLLGWKPQWLSEIKWHWDLKARVSMWFVLTLLARSIKNGHAYSDYCSFANWRFLHDAWHCLAKIAILHTIKALCTCQHCMRCTLPIEISDTKTGPTFVLMWSNQDVPTRPISSWWSAAKNCRISWKISSNTDWTSAVSGSEASFKASSAGWTWWRVTGVDALWGSSNQGVYRKHPQTRYSGYTQNGMFYGGKMFWTKGKCG